jgi:prepilin-type N-terminal cleavage/methylation domain-containing protein
MTLGGRPFGGRRVAGQDGFTLIELQVVLVITAIIVGMTVISFQSAMPNVYGNAAMDQVMSAFRRAREAAITQRRTVDVQFVLPNQIRLVRNDIPNGQTEIGRVILEHQAQFMTTPGVNVDTDDQFGMSQAIWFQGAQVFRYLPDGSFTDGSDVPINGTVSIGIPNQFLAARAITVTGGTGRPQGYRWAATEWEAE